MEHPEKFKPSQEEFLMRAVLRRCKAAFWLAVGADRPVAYRLNAQRIQANRPGYFANNRLS